MYAEETEPLGWLKAIGPGNGYNSTRYWKRLRTRILDDRKWICEFCGLTGAPREEGEAWTWKATLVLHHLNYDRIGEELDGDLMVVCVACHNLIHRPRSSPAKYWLAQLVRLEWLLDDDSEGPGSRLEIAQRAAKLAPKESFSDVTGFSNDSADLDEVG